MRYIFIVLFLVSFGSVSLGGVGDKYKCHLLKHSQIMGDQTYPDVPIKDSTLTFVTDEKKAYLTYAGENYEYKILKIESQGFSASEQIDYTILNKHNIIHFLVTGPNESDYLTWTYMVLHIVTVKFFECPKKL